MDENDPLSEYNKIPYDDMVLIFFLNRENPTIGNTRVSVAYYSFYDNIQLFHGMKVTAMEYNLWSYQ